MKTCPAFKAALFFSSGIVIGEFIPFSISILYIASLCCIMALIFLFIKRIQLSAIPILIGAVLALMGAFRSRQEKLLLPENHIVRVVPDIRTLELRAFLIRDPARKMNRVELLVETEAAALGDSIIPAAGKVLVPFYETEICSLHYGDEIVLKGRLERPRGRRNPGGFDYRAYLERKGIRAILRPEGPIQAVKRTGLRRANSLMRNTVYPVRRFILGTVERTCDAESQPVLKALLVGDQNSIPDDVRQGFSKSGAVHILSVSGSHVGFVYLILLTVFAVFRLPVFLRTILTVAGLIYYCLLAEANAPVVRATLMAAMHTIGSLFERKSDPYNVVGMSALVYLALIPRDLFDLSFQLSFASVLSILFFYRRLKGIRLVRKMESGLSQHDPIRLMIPGVLVSVAAQIGTLPIIALAFNQIPVLSVFANLLAIPLSGLIVALGFTTFLAAPLHFSTASVYGILNQKLLVIFIRSLVWIGSRPFSHIDVPSPDPSVMVLYAAGILLVVFYQNPNWRKAAVWMFFISANVCAWKPVVVKSWRGAVWTVFDVGQGDASLFQLPRGRCMLVDGGPRTPDWDAGESVIIPYLRKTGIRKIDCMVLTHPHDDHAGGLVSVLNNFKVGRVVIPDDSFRTPICTEILGICFKKKIPISKIRAPDSLAAFDGMKIYFLSPDRADRFEYDNDRSLVMRILYGKRKWLLMGDAGLAVESQLASSHGCLQSDAIKIGHHGSSSASSETFIQKVHPEMALISVGLRNRFGHPDPAVLQVLRNKKIEICRTDKNGAVVLKTNGEKTFKFKCIQ